jgi:SpoVK/Ycf46/Vps4 family AAA+-type ATPase
LEEVENVLSKLLVLDRTITLDSIATIFAEKQKIVRKTGILEFFPSQDEYKVGGLQNLVKWLTKRSRVFSSEAQKAGIEPPKGVLITGIPGCGKSLTVKAAASIMKLPLLRFDVGKIFEGLVGASEQNMRTAIATAEAAAPAILWIDEIEKAFPSGQGELDGGTSIRVFGNFLTWMQEKTSPIFVMATSNNTSRLPPEMLRKGRFDEIFFVDLPLLEERCEIFRIHLEKRGKSPDDFDLTKLAEASEGFSGSEIEAAVQEAILDAFCDNRPTIDQQDIIRILERSPPLSARRKEEIEAIRNWANIQAVRASAVPQSSQHDRARQAAGRNIDY